VLFDAVAAALGASDSVAESLHIGSKAGPEAPPPDAVMQQLREGFRSAPDAAINADDTLRLAEAVRQLAVKHGPPAVQHCIRFVESLRELLDDVTGTSEGMRDEG
jgi:two-component system, NtrC family, nitrogen regulation response regulator NtrX